MERVYGQSILNYILQRQGSVNNEETAQNIMRPILHAINFMHENGVVHRDMNPTNVFINFEVD